MRASTSLKRVAGISYGLGQPPELRSDGVPILRATNVHRGSIRAEGLIFAAKDDLPLDRAPLLQRGEILVVRSGAYTGDSALVTEPWEGCAPGYDLRVTPTQLVDSRFAAYTLLSSRALDEMRILSSRAAQPHLNAEELGEVTVDLPTVAEQRAIADYLDTETARIDALITKKRRLIELLLERRSATALDHVGGVSHSERQPSSIQWLEDVPADWEQVMVKLVAGLGSGHTPSRNHAEWWMAEECTIPWITTGEVSRMRSDQLEYLSSTRECISEVGMANSSAVLHPTDTVALSRTASAGYSAIMAEPMAVSQDFVVWRCGPRLRPRFLLLCLRAMRNDLLERLAMGSTHRTIYMPDIESIRIPLPPPAEQDQIVEAVWAAWGRIDQAADRIGRQVDLLIEKRQALITAAVTGELEIPAEAR